MSKGIGREVEGGKYEIRRGRENKILLDATDLLQRSNSYPHKPYMLFHNIGAHAFSVEYVNMSYCAIYNVEGAEERGEEWGEVGDITFLKTRKFL